MARWGVAADDFNRAAGAVGANYTVLKGGLSISSGKVHGTGSAHNIGFWSASAFANDQYAKVTIDGANHHEHWAAARISGTNSTDWDAYVCVWNNDVPTADIYRFLNSSGTVLGHISSAAGFFAGGDTIEIEVTGPVAPGWPVTIKMLKNGSSVGIAYDNSSFNNFTSGAAGFGFFDNDGYGDTWQGGNIVPIGTLRTQSITRRFVSS